MGSFYDRNRYPGKEELNSHSFPTLSSGTLFLLTDNPLRYRIEEKVDLMLSLYSIVDVSRRRYILLPPFPLTNIELDVP